MPWYSNREDAKKARDLLNKIARENGDQKRWYTQYRPDHYGTEQWEVGLDPSTDPNPASPSLDEEDYRGLVDAGL